MCSQEGPNQRVGAFLAVLSNSLLGVTHNFYDYEVPACRGSPGVALGVF